MCIYLHLTLGNGFKRSTNIHPYSLCWEGVDIWGAPYYKGASRLCYKSLPILSPHLSCGIICGAEAIFPQHWDKVQGSFCLSLARYPPVLKDIWLGLVQEVGQHARCLPFSGHPCSMPGKGPECNFGNLMPYFHCVLSLLKDYIVPCETSRHPPILLCKGFVYFYCCPSSHKKRPSLS